MGLYPVLPLTVPYYLHPKIWFYSVMEMVPMLWIYVRRGLLVYLSCDLRILRKLGWWDKPGKDSTLKREGVE